MSKTRWIAVGFLAYLVLMLGVNMLTISEVEKARANLSRGIKAEDTTR